MFCEKCGEKISDSALFCKNCGAKTESESSGIKKQPLAKPSNKSKSDKLDYEQTKAYLKMVFDMETNLLIQQATIDELHYKRDKLGIKEVFERPVHRTAGLEISDSYINIGGWTGVAAGVILTFSHCESCSVFAIIPGAFFGALIGGAVCLIAYLILYIKARYDRVAAQNTCDAMYKRDMDRYNEKVKKDEERVQKENIKRGQIYTLITSLEKKMQDSEKILDKIYAINIVDPKYHNSISAISSFYEYFTTKRTKSLGFNDETGDQGAYNIYEQERRLGKIIDNTEIIIDRLDEVLENQRTLSDALSAANDKITSLSNSVNGLSTSMNAINAGIQENNAIMRYNGERTQAELSYMNSINTMNFISNASKK